MYYVMLLLSIQLLCVLFSPNHLTYNFFPFFLKLFPPSKYPNVLLNISSPCTPFNKYVVGLVSFTFLTMTISFDQLAV
jgi:hypothetical protein